MPEDKGLWREVWEHLSPTSVYYRFFTQKKGFTEAEVKYFTEPDFVNHVALIALIEEQGRLTPVAVARYIVNGSTGKNAPLSPAQRKSSDSSTRSATAEVALAVDDEYQGLGIGTQLLRHLGIIAKASGLRRLNAVVMSENRKMIEVFEHCGLPMKSHFTDAGICNVTLSLLDD